MIRNYLTAIFLTTFLFACGGGSGGENSLVASEEASNLTGIWDLSENLSSQEFDELYLVLRQDGSGVFFDYLGDSFNQGDNCYFETPFVYENSVNDQFLIIYEDGFEIALDELTVENNTLTFNIEDIQFSGVREFSLGETNFRDLPCEPSSNSPSPPESSTFSPVSV